MLKRGERSTFVRSPSLLILCLAMIFPFIEFYPELVTPAVHMSDVTLHLSILHSLDTAVRSGGGFLDFWYDTSPFGYPLFRTYQHLPHLLLYGVYRLFNASIELESWLRWSAVFLVSVLPLSVYVGGRWMGLSRLSSACAGLSVTLLAENKDYGLGLHNYYWGSGGIITQLWGAIFLFPALAAGAVYLREGRMFWRALLLAFLTCGSHLVLGFILGVSLFGFFLCSLSLPNVVGRFIRYTSGIVVVTAYQWVIVIQDLPYFHRSPLEPDWKFASHGISWVMTNFWNGDLFDWNRFPTLTILVLVGLGATLLGQSERAKIPTWNLVVLFLVWLAIFCGHELLGPLASLPIIRNLHMHRLVVAVQLFGVYLAGLGVSTVCSLVRLRIVPCVALMLLFISPLKERWARLQESHSWMSQSMEELSRDSDLSNLMQELSKLPRGWVHVGMEHTWAKSLQIGPYLSLRHVTLGAGIPTMGQLYHAFGVPGDVLFDLNPDRKVHYDILGVRYTVAPPDWPAPPFLKRNARFGRYVLYEYPEAHMIGVSANVPLVPPDVSSMERSNLMRSWFVLAQDELAPGTVTEESPWQPHFVSATVELQSTAWVVLKTGFHPNWKVSVDGTEQETKWVGPGFVATWVPPGKHFIGFSYSPSLLKPLLFYTGLLYLLVLAQEHALGHRRL